MTTSSRASAGRLASFKSLAARDESPFDDRFDQPVQFYACEFSRIVERREDDFGFGQPGKVLLRLSHGCADDEQARIVEFLLDFALNKPDQDLVDIVPTEVGVTARGQNLEDAFSQLEDRNIESPAAEVVNGNGAVRPFFKAIG